MTIRTLTKTIERQYKNNGQHLEQLYRYNMTGRLEKADNREGADLDNIQIKSARATVCKGTDCKAYIENDIATVYAYVIKDGTKAYEMNKTEWIAFVEMFGTVTTESGKNNGGLKIRLKCESKAMIDYLNR